MDRAMAHRGGDILHTLILAAPGMGKTTFLRDLVRVLSDRPTCRGLALIDERYELAAANFGIPQNDVGLHTDVYSGYAKEAGCMQAIRTMAPQILAVDEIGGKKDLESLVYAMHCGVGVLATMHAGSLLEYQQKREWEPLLENVISGVCSGLTKSPADGSFSYMMKRGNCYV